jgi:YbgC/YbaW family acyl-CoA thioester hydrolase
MERGRTELINSTGKGIAEWNAEGFLLVVHSLTMKFKRAAALGDRLDVVSRLTMDSRYRATFHQRIERGNEVVTEADVVIACLDARHELTEFPPGLRSLATPA